MSISGLIFIGYQTYNEAPPIPDYVDSKGNAVISKSDILAGQEVFHRYALMEYGSMFGDGALRGPDFTAQTLHEMAESLKEFYRVQSPTELSPLELAGIEELIKKELKKNRYKAESNQTELSEAQIFAASEINTFYQRVFLDPDFKEAFKPAGYLKDPSNSVSFSTGELGYAVSLGRVKRTAIPTIGPMTLKPEILPLPPPCFGVCWDCLDWCWA